MSKTQENLMAAFAGESQANRKYLAFAEVADKEGLPQVAKLFRAAAAAETIHAHAHLRNAGHIGNTAENLKAALEGETYEFTKMYPEMIKEAEAEGNASVAKYFGYVNTVEEVHPICTRKPWPIPRVWRKPTTTCAKSAATRMKAPATSAPCAAPARRRSSIPPTAASNARRAVMVSERCAAPSE